MWPVSHNTVRIPQKKYARSIIHWLHSRILLRRYCGSIVEVLLVMPSYSTKDILPVCKIWYNTVKIPLVKYVDNNRNTVRIPSQYFSGSIVPCKWTQELQLWLANFRLTRCKLVSSRHESCKLTTHKVATRKLTSLSLQLASLHLVSFQLASLHLVSFQLASLHLVSVQLASLFATRKFTSCKFPTRKFTSCKCATRKYTSCKFVCNSQVYIL